MDYELFQKQYNLINEPLTKKEKNWIFQNVLQKAKTEEEICFYGEILEEKEEKN